MEFSASAPCKAIMFGEHYVVWGAPALSIAIEPRNYVKFSDAKRDKKAALLSSVYGKGEIGTGGAYSGAPELEIFSEVAKKIFGEGKVPPFSAEFFSAWALKGVGTSSSLCAAFAAGCFSLAGRKAAAEEIFAAAQAGDLLAHAGKASGIDAKTVSYGKPLVFQRSFSPPAFKSSPAEFSLPSGTSLLLIDTNKGVKDGTGKLIGVFAKSFGISSPPQEVPEEKRQEVQGEYLPVWESVKKSMRNASGRKLGEIMNDCHYLLKARGVSSAGIESAVAAALSSGAYGAKITGAGGEGGAVLALCESKKCEDAGKKITEATGFSCYPVSLAKKGAMLD